MKRGAQARQNRAVEPDSKREVGGQAKKLALHCARAAGAKKGIGIVVLDIRHISPIADFFVIVSGGTDKHVRAMADEIALRAQKDLGQKTFHVEGFTEGTWVIMDYVDVVVHLFTEPSRAYYNLDRLWGDAKVIKLLG